MAQTVKEDPKIRTDYKPSDEEHKVLQFVYSRYESMKDSPDRQKAAGGWDKWIEQWEAVRKEADRVEEWQSNHYVPLTMAVVEAALAEIVDQTPQPLILPLAAEDVSKARVMSNIFKYTWDVADGDTELYNLIKDALILGTGIGQEYYFKDRRMIRNLKLDKNGKEQFVEEEDFDFDDCYLEAVRLQDFFVDEKARGFLGPYGARDAIRRYVMDIDDFRLFFSGPVWDPLGNAKLVKPGGDTNYYEFYKPPEGIKKDKEVEVLWYWGKKPYDALWIIANDVVIRMGPNIYKHKQLPFIRIVDVKRTHRFYGKGEPEILESVNDEINLLRRMILDRNHLDIDKMFIGSVNLSLNDEDLIARPHGLIPADDVNSVKAVEYGDVPRSVDLSVRYLQEDATIATGVDPRSITNTAPGTATEAAILRESALKRIRMKMRLLERETLIPAARLRVANIIQFYPQPRLEKIVGEAGTAEYNEELKELQDKGMVEMIGGDPMKKTYRTIRLDGKELTPDQNGEFQEHSIQGVSFFELDPKYFIPTARGGFEIKYAAGSTIPVSKTLQQTKVTEMSDRLMPLALAGVGYDPVKIGDKLIESNDYNPDDFKADKPANEDVTGARAEQLIELGIKENELMMKGQAVAPTAFASPAHTMIHTMFMNSKTYQEIPPDDPRNQIFIDHVVGELMAQTARQTAGSAPAQNGTMPNGELPPQTQTQVPVEAMNPKLKGDRKGHNKTLKGAMPLKIQGGGDTEQVV